MLHLYNLNKNKIKGLVKYKDYFIESTLSTGDKVLSFIYPSKLAKDIKEECYIRTKKHEFVVKEVNSQDDYTSITAVLNVEALEGQAWEHFSTVEQTIEQCLTLALAGTGWTAQVNNVTKKRTIRKTNCSTWDIIQQAKKTYLVEIEFDSLNKIVKVYEKLGSDKGAYFMESLNLKLLEIQSNSYEFYTRLIAIGKDNLKATVENYNYSTKKKTLIWKDERYTDINSLTEDASAKLAELSKPYKAYRVDVIDLANMSDKYSLLSYSLGDTITLISKDKGIKEKQRIVKIKEYPEEPERNMCEIANSILSFVDMQKDFQDTSDTVNNITSDNGTIAEGAIRTTVEHITINKADIQDLNVVRQRVGTLETNKLDANEAYLKFTKIDEALIAKADVVDLTAANIKFNTAEGGTMSLQTLLSKEVFTELASVGKIVAGSSIIAEEAIGSSQISSLDVVKLNAGDISTAKFTILGTNGRLKIVNNRLQVFANKADNSLYERVSLGDVNGDGTVYGLRVRGADGVTVLLDETGVKREGITDGSINNAKIGADANISGTKLDIASVVTSINNGTTTIQGSKIYVDGKTLDLSFSTLKSTVTSQGESINSQSAQITALDGAIKLKVDTQTYNAKISVIDGNISTINTSLSKATSDISVLQGQIALKVEQTDINTAVDNIEIGGRNLFTNSENFLSYKKGSDTGNTLISDAIRDVDGDYQTITFINNGNIYFYPTSNITRIQGETYTISLEVKTNTTYGFYWYPSENIIVPKNDKDAIPNTNGEWKRWSYTYTQTGPNKGGAVLFGFQQAAAGEEMSIRKLKLEKGNKATDWTPAPEDIDSSINTAEINSKSYADTKKTEAINTAATDATTKANNAKTGAVADAKTYTDGQISTVNTTISNKVGEIKVTTDNITSRVASTESNISTINGQVSSLTSRVSTAEQKITDSAIISTVRTSTAYQGDLNSKEGSITKNNTAPSSPTSNQLWLDTSVTPNILKRWNGSAWVKATPSTAAEVGAYSASDGSALAGRISTAESSITQLNNSIASKVSQTDFNSLTGRVNTAESTISQHSTQIATKVDVNGVKSTIQQNPSSVQIGFNGINNNVQIDSSGLSLAIGSLNIKDVGKTIFNASKDVLGNVGIELGLLTTVKNAYIDFHSSGTGNDYDTRIIAGGGNSNVSQGNLGLNCAKLDLNDGKTGLAWFHLRKGTGDGASWATYNVGLDTWQGIGIGSDIGSGFSPKIIINGRNGNIDSVGNLTIGGSKNRAVQTESYGTRCLSAYETAESFFGDLGAGIINSDGECIVFIDDIFLECINTKQAYHVFTSTYNGKVDSIERHEHYFIVKGEPNTEFSWELKVKQKGFEYDRLNDKDSNLQQDVIPSSALQELGYSINSSLEEDLMNNLDEFLLEGGI